MAFVISADFFDAAAEVHLLEDSTRKLADVAGLPVAGSGDLTQRCFAPAKVLTGRFGRFPGPPAG